MRARRDPEVPFDRRAVGRIRRRLGKAVQGSAAEAGSGVMRQGRRASRCHGKEGHALGVVTDIARLALSPEAVLTQQLQDLFRIEL